MFKGIEFRKYATFWTISVYMHEKRLDQINVTFKPHNRPLPPTNYAFSLSESKFKPN